MSKAIRICKTNHYCSSVNYNKILGYQFSKTACFSSGDIMWKINENIVSKEYISRGDICVYSVHIALFNINRSWSEIEANKFYLLSQKSIVINFPDNILWDLEDFESEPMMCAWFPLRTEMRNCKCAISAPQMRESRLGSRWNH